MIATYESPRDARTRLQYLASDPLYLKEKPLQIVPGFLDREKRSNVKLEPGDEEIIRDVRGCNESFKLDTHGFQYLKAPTSFKEWNSQNAIGEIYLAEVEELLKKEVQGCDEIVFFDARLRHKEHDGTRIEGLSYNPFARQVHVDQTESSIITKIRALTELKADFLLKGRVRIINVWRPIRHPVFDCALAVADGGSLLPGDVIECDRYRRDTGTFWDTMGVVQFRRGYSWYYMSRQDEEDVLLFKNYDSDKSVVAPYCLHTAFDLDDVPDGSPARESVEVRALVFTFESGDDKQRITGIGERPFEMANLSGRTIEELMAEIQKWKARAEYFEAEAASLRKQISPGV